MEEGQKRPVYVMKDENAEEGGDADDAASAVICFYWRFSTLKDGWWLASKYGSKDGIKAFCPKTLMHPPKRGWQVGSLIQPLGWHG
jgi:hypothetical protein